MKPGLPAVSRAAYLQRAALLTVCVLIVIMSTLRALASDEAGGRWRFLARDTPYSIRYYEREAPAGESEGLRRVWTRTIPTAEGNPHITEIRSLWELDCGKRAFRNLRAVIVYKDGLSEDTETPRDWTEARPEIWVAGLWKIICEGGSGDDHGVEPKGTPPR